MATGEYTPKNPEVELRVLKELYNQTAYIYKQYNGGVLAAEHGKGTRTDRYDITTLMFLEISLRIRPG